MEHETVVDICRSTGGKEADDVIVDEDKRCNTEMEGSYAVEIKKEPTDEETENSSKSRGPELVASNCNSKAGGESIAEIVEMESETDVDTCFCTEVKKEPVEEDVDEAKQNSKTEIELNCTAKVKKEPTERERRRPRKRANGHGAIVYDDTSETEEKPEVVDADKEQNDVNMQAEDDGGIARRLRKVIPTQVIKYEDIYFAPKRPSARRKKTRGSGSSRTRRRTRARKYCCETCGKGFYSQDVLKSHCLRHTGGKRFKCEICGKGYSWHTSYQNHMLTHTGETPYKCSFCDKILCNKLSLQGHVMRIHNKVERTFACDRCDRRFINKYELKYHRANHEEQRRFMCDMCGKSLSTKNDLASHRLIHTGERPFICTVCQKGFIRKSQLEEHMRQHTDGYSYQCEVCGKQYSSKRSLQRHLLIHSDTRPYKCNQCEKDFKCRSALASHKDSHLGIKRHICEFCGKAFLSEPNMHKHKKRHLGVKNEVCALCSKAFITKQELRAHMRSHTREPRVKKKAKVIDDNTSDYKDPVSPDVPSSSDTPNNHSSLLAADLKESSSRTQAKCVNENQNCNTAIVYLSTEGDSTSDCDYSDIPTSSEKLDNSTSNLLVSIREKSSAINSECVKDKNCDATISENTE